MVVYDRNGQARDTAVGGFVPQRDALGKTYAVIFLQFRDVDVPFVRQSSELEHARRQRLVEEWYLY